MAALDRASCLAPDACREQIVDLAAHHPGDPAARRHRCRRRPVRRQRLGARSRRPRPPRADRHVRSAVAGRPAWRARAGRARLVLGRGDRLPRRRGGRRCRLAQRAGRSVAARCLAHLRQDPAPADALTVESHCCRQAPSFWLPPDASARDVDVSTVVGKLHQPARGNCVDRTAMAAECRLLHGRGCRSCWPRPWS